MNKKERSDKAVLGVRRFISYLVLTLLSIICLFSFYILVINATRANAQIQQGFSVIPGQRLLANIKTVFANKEIPILYGLRNSFIISASCAVFTTYFSALTAYAIHAYNFRFKNAAFTFILMIMMVPAQVSSMGFVNLMKSMHFMNTFIPLIVPSIAAPVVFFFMKQYMESSLPIEIIEAARIDGSSEFRTFNHVVLPILKPAVAVQAIFAFVSSWNNYFVPALILEDAKRKTLPIMIAMYRSADYLKFDMGQVYMVIAISILPVVVVYLCLSKFIVQGVAIGSVKG